MKRFNVMILFLLLTVVSAVQASNISIVPEDQTGYDEWLPSYGNSLTFFVSVTGASSSGSISFNLTNVSAWTGQYMNKGDETTKDLLFPSQEDKAYASVEKAQSDELLGGSFDESELTWTISSLKQTATLSWVADTNLPSTFTIPVTVNSEDGGSFGTLVATFNSNYSLDNFCLLHVVFSSPFYFWTSFV